MKIYNTLTCKKEEFVPLSPGRATIYACGVTVYDHCHIGHARSAVVFDIMRRYLNYRGLDVLYVRNFTDIDDKIINRAKQEGVSWDEVAKKYTDEYYRDMDRLGVGRGDREPKATEHIQEIIGIIRGLIGKGYAYAVDGDVYFEVKKFPDYGKLSKRDTEDMLAGARVEVSEKKRNPMDFTLWKASKDGEPSWESQWGPGRPGWHIECTAMSIKYLGESFEIHGGGADLIFPHHENELAQSEAYTGKQFVKYWIHNGFITIDREKMSKSLGNFFTIREILDRFDPEVVRFFLLSTHYRSPIEFSDEQLMEAELSIDRYYTTVARIEDFLKEGPMVEKSIQGERSLEEALTSFLNRFREAMDDDFNTAQALGHIFELIRGINRFLDTRPSGQRAKDLLLKAADLLQETGSILNIFTRRPEEWYDSLMVTKEIPFSKEEIMHRLRERQEARQKHDWARADAIRKELEGKGIILEDKRGGTSWRVRLPLTSE